jgi:hypothetical protein
MNKPGLAFRLSRILKVRALLLALAMAGATAPSSSGQEPESMVDRILARIEAMEFEFTRSESEIPFLPALSLGHRIYGETVLQREKGGGEKITFRSHATSAYAALPLYIGKRGLALAVPYIGHTRFRFTGGDQEDGEVTSIYLPAGAAWQTETKKQWGWFVMPAAYSALQDDADWAASAMAGILGRQLRGDRLIWYYGLVYDHSFDNGYFLPYLGFTYVLNPNWAFAMVAPWPSISYAPHDGFFLQIGIAPSGATWSLSQRDDKERVIASFGGWDLGAWANWRLSGSWWLSAGTGFSGLRSLSVGSDGDVSFDQRLDREPWVGITINMRPGP